MKLTANPNDIQPNWMQIWPIQFKRKQ